MPKHAILMIAYLVTLHGALVCAIVKCDALKTYARQHGWLESRYAEHYRHMSAYHKRVDACVPEGAVLFIGDSFIQSMCVAAIVERGVNWGIGGDTTAGVLSRLSEYTSLARARAVVLMVGHNDLSQRDNEVIVRNYGKIIERIRRDCPILFCSILPIDEGCRSERVNDRIRELNRAAAELCAKTQDCLFVDITRGLTDDEGRLMSAYHEGDGVHLNATGYQIVNERLKMMLQQRTSETGPKNG